MGKRSDSKLLALISLTVAVATMTIAFAALSTKLDIGVNDTSVMVNGKWQVIFTNVSTSVTGSAKVDTAPQIDASDKTKINDYAASFKDPGDSLTVNFTVKNGGTINAKLVDIVMSETPTCTSTASPAIVDDATKVCAELTYVLTDTNDIAITENDILNAGELKTMKLVLTYVANPLTFDNTNLPSSSVSITDLGVSLKYNQK